MIDVAFSTANALALLGWVFLLVLPGWEPGRRWIAGLILPLIFAVAYLMLFPALWISAPGGFSSLDELSVLLNHDQRILFAAWLHYLAFDLLIGGAILDDSRSRGVGHIWMIAPLLLCFVMGPIGWLLYQGVKQFAPDARAAA